MTLSTKNLILSFKNRINKAKIGDTYLMWIKWSSALKANFRNLRAVSSQWLRAEEPTKCLKVIPVQTDSYKNSHGDAKYSIGNTVNNMVITMCNNYE